MASQPSVSIVIPVYNMASSIDATLSSLAAQTDDDFEVVVIDDGSTDETRQTIKAFTLSQPLARLKVVSAPNRGVSVARNAGAKISTGEYVMFLDGDDVVAPQLVGRLRQHVESDHRPDIIAWSYETVTHPPHLEGASDGSTRTAVSLTGPELLRELILGTSIRVWTGSAAYRRTYLETAPLAFTPGCSAGEDREFIYKAVAGATSTLVLDDKLSYYVVRPGSLSWGVELRHFQSVLAHLRAKDHIAAMGDHSLEPLANLIVTRKAVPAYFRYLARYVTSSQEDGDIAAFLMAIEKQYPGLNATMRRAVWTRLRNRDGLNPLMSAFLVSPRAFSLGVRLLHRRTPSGQ